MKKQIEEMAKIMCRSCYRRCDDTSGCIVEDYAEAIYNAGYRKQIEGHWFITEYEYFTCSECDHDHYNGCDSTKEAKERLADGEYPNFCPNCGAKMKGADNGKAD